MDFEENITLKNLNLLIFQKWGGCKSGSIIGFFAQELQKKNTLNDFTWTKAILLKHHGHQFLFFGEPFAL